MNPSDWSSDVCLPIYLQLMLNLMKPKYFIPVQGEYRQLAAHADLAHEIGMPYKDIFITDRKSVVQGKSVDLGGRRIIKKKKRSEESCGGKEGREAP